MLPFAFLEAGVLVTIVEEKIRAMKTVTKERESIMSVVYKRVVVFGEINFSV